MKKVISIIISILMVFSLCACGDDTPSAKDVAGTYTYGEGWYLQLNKDGTFINFVDVPEAEPMTGTFVLGEENAIYFKGSENGDLGAALLNAMNLQFDATAKVLHGSADGITTVMNPTDVTYETIFESIDVDATDPQVEEVVEEVAKETSTSRFVEQADGTCRYEAKQPHNKVSAEDIIPYLGKTVDEFIDEFGSCTAIPSDDAPAYMITFDCAPKMNFGYCAADGCQAVWPYAETDVMYSFGIWAEGVETLYGLKTGDSLETAQAALAGKCNTDEILDGNWVEVDLGNNTYAMFFFDYETHELTSVDVTYRVYN